MKEKAIAFLFGDLFVTIHVVLAGILSDIGHFSLKVLATIIIGLAGGIAGLAGKELYPEVKKKFKSLFKIK